MHPTCLLIDHDDTLVSTFELRAKVVAGAITKYLARPWTARRICVRPMGRARADGTDFSDDPARVQAFIDTYRESYYRENKLGGVNVLPGIAETLAELHAAGIEIAVVTSKLGQGASDELEACGLRHFVLGVVGSEHVTHPKPNPEPLEKGFAHLSGDDISAALMVGDTTADIMGARAAGAVAGAALWGTSDAQSLLASKPDLVLETPRKFVQLWACADGGCNTRVRGDKLQYQAIARCTAGIQHGQVPLLRILPGTL